MTKLTNEELLTALIRHTAAMGGKVSVSGKIDELRAEILQRMAEGAAGEAALNVALDYPELVLRVKDTIKHDLDPDGSLESHAETMADFCRKEILAAVNEVATPLIREARDAACKMSAAGYGNWSAPLNKAADIAEAAFRPSELGSHGEANLPRDAAENRPEDYTKAGEASPQGDLLAAKKLLELRDEIAHLELEVNGSQHDHAEFESCDVCSEGGLFQQKTHEYRHMAEDVAAQLATQIVSGSASTAGPRPNATTPPQGATEYTTYSTPANDVAIVNVCKATEQALKKLLDRNRDGSEEYKVCAQLLGDIHYSALNFAEPLTTRKVKAILANCGYSDATIEEFFAAAPAEDAKEK